MTMGQTVAAIACVAAAFATSAALTYRLSGSPRLFSRMVDTPNERSMHGSPVPRTGGVAVLAALAIACALAVTAFSLHTAWVWLGVAILLIAGISFLDDRGEVRAAYRLAAHLLAALLVFAGGVAWSRVEVPGLAWENPHVLSWVLTLAYLVWMVNLYNFMDGMDGFAAGMALFGFGALALLGWKAGDFGFALANAVLVSAAGGFLLGNFPPARIFLGDMGSASLGLLAGVLSLVGSERGVFPLWVAWLAFSPFIVDATWTLLRRLSRGERVWEAHRSHHYQRLVLAGWSHRKTVLLSYVLMAACAATAVAAPDMSVRDQWLLIAAWAIIYWLIGFKTRLSERLAGAAPP
jgi:UDP-N-acetylmuramyl pentapeptide phosphotransferase/UDP-N-acetylglucosamine-1-phosphate transferase